MCWEEELCVGCLLFDETFPLLVKKELQRIHKIKQLKRFISASSVLEKQYSIAKKTGSHVATFPCHGELDNGMVSYQA